MDVEEGASRAATPSRSDGVRITTVASLLTTLTVLPTMLLGALAVLARQELQFSRAGLGVAIGTYFGASSLTAFPAGRFTERVGARRTMMASTTMSVASLLGIGLLVHSWIALVVCLAVAGLGNSLAHPAANLALSRRVPTHWQGLAFGIKQASIPLAGLLSGISVPTIALGTGWRTAFAGGSILALPIAYLLATQHHLDPERRSRRREPGDGMRLMSSPLLVLAFGFGLGSMAANSLGGFLVEFAVADGTAVSTAGVLFAVNNGLGIVARIAHGWRADRRGARHLLMVATLLAVGAVGFVCLSISGRGWLLWLGSFLGFVGGWSWPGLFNFAIVRAFPVAPASATGATLAGGYAGSTFGPILFGLVVRTWSFNTAWLALAGTCVLAASLMVAGRALVMRTFTEPGSRIPVP